MLVYPKWLRVSQYGNAVTGAIVEAKDADASMNAIFQALNGNLSDENVAQIPYGAVAFFSEAHKRLGAPPSWKGHIHDGRSARRLASGYVQRDDLKYDGSLGVLNHPESDTYYVAAAPQYVHGLHTSNPPSFNLVYPVRVGLFCGKLSFEPGAGGSGPTEATATAWDTAWMYPVMTSVPMDMADVGGLIAAPVVVASLRAEMVADTLPEKGLPNDGTTFRYEERFSGLGINNIEVWPDYGEMSPDTNSANAAVVGFDIHFDLMLPGPENPVTKGVGRWCVDWLMLCKFLRQPSEASL
jgi:hypothetical protein